MAADNKCEVCGEPSEQTYCSNACARTGKAYNGAKVHQYERLVKAGAIGRHPQDCGPMGNADPDGVADLVATMSLHERRERKRTGHVCLAPCRTLRFASFIYGADVIELLREGVL